MAIITLVSTPHLLFVSVGTRSAFAAFTLASAPPLEAGSAGWQVNTLTRGAAE